MSLHAQVLEDYKQAFKNKDTLKKEILNFVISSLKNKQIELQKDLTDDDVIKVIKKEIKGREESIVYLEKAHDIVGVQTEEAKIAVLEKYLPVMMSEEQLHDIVKHTIEQMGITDIQKQKGQIIGAVMKEHGSLIDGALLQKVLNNFTPSS